MPMEFIAKLELRNDDQECERLYEEYKKAKAALSAYLFKEGISVSTVKKEAASGN